MWCGKVWNCGNRCLMCLMMVFQWTVMNLNKILSHDFELKLCKDRFSELKNGYKLKFHQDRSHQ